MSPTARLSALWHLAAACLSDKGKRGVGHEFELEVVRRRGVRRRSKDKMIMRNG
jgi:hypothetical protein